MSLRLHMQALGAEVEPLLEQLGVPLYLVDAHGMIRWQNQASIRRHLLHALGAHSRVEAVARGREKGLI